MLRSMLDISLFTSQHANDFTHSAETSLTGYPPLERFVIYRFALARDKRARNDKSKQLKLAAHAAVAPPPTGPDRPAGRVPPFGRRAGPWCGRGRRKRRRSVRAKVPSAAGPGTC